jgi:hypothetical protein
MGKKKFARFAALATVFVASQIKCFPDQTLIIIAQEAIY